MVLKIEKKENPYKKVRKPVPRPGYVIGGNKRLSNKKKRQNEKRIIDSILDNLNTNDLIIEDDDLYDDFE